MLDAFPKVPSMSLRQLALSAGLVALIVAGVATSASLWASPPQKPLVFAQAIALPDVRGRIDHFAVDVEGERLFVAALGNGTVEVVDLRAGVVSERLKGLQDPQGIGYVPSTGRLFVANGGGRVDVYAGKPFVAERRVERLDDADNVRHDAARGAIYVGYGSALVELDAATGSVAARIGLAGHPESFQLERESARMFVNIPSARQIAVVDRDRRTQIAKWPLEDLAANFPMALDERQHRLFVATRRPAALLVYDSDTGKRIARLPIGGDADDLFYDAARRRIYVICGEGAVDVVRVRDADHYELAGRVATARGARTGLFVAERSALYVAVPARDASPAEIRVYGVR